MPSQEPDQPKTICFECVQEKYLRNEILKAGVEMVCSYCGETHAAYSLEDVATRVNKAFEDYYERVCDQTDIFGRPLDGEPVVWAIAGAADISEEAAKDIQSILAERHYDHELAKMSEDTEFGRWTKYSEKSIDTNAWREAWDDFEKSLKERTRFFSRSAAELLESVFEAVDSMKSGTDKSFVVNVGPDFPLKSLFRAREFQDYEVLEKCLGRPDLHLSGPPPRHAKAGRMNARGISVFYAAATAKVAIAEVRPPVGCFVVVARFDLLRNLRLLDLTALKDWIRLDGSIFDSEHLKLLQRVAFLQELSNRLTRPITPNDEALEYVPTQAVADFLASSPMKLDGIIFPSVQASEGLNVVLFHKAALVEKFDLPEGSQIDVMPAFTYPNGDASDYSVTVTLPAEPKPAPSADGDAFPSIKSMAELEEEAAESRQASLKLAGDSMTVHYVKHVDVGTDHFAVNRYSRRASESSPF